MGRHKKRRKHKVRDHYFLPAGNQLVEVSENVYNAYYEETRYGTYHQEQADVNGVVSYNVLDNDMTLGEELVLDPFYPSAEDYLFSKELLALLHRSILALPEEDQKLIQAIFYEHITQEQYGQMKGVSQPAVCQQLQRVLGKLRKMLTI